MAATRRLHRSLRTVTKGSIDAERDPKSNDLPCSFNVNFENRDMSLEYLRNKMEDMEPRVSGIGGKLQKVTEDVENCAS